MWPAIIIIVILAILVLWAISAQRQLVNIDELCGNALSQIGVQQNSRWDALTALADLTKGYSEHEHKTLMDIIAQRKPIGATSTTEEAQEQENILTQAMGKFMAVAEAYPDLKANDMYGKTMDSVKQYEENVRHSRMIFNDTVTKFNRNVRQIPMCFIANAMGFKVREYLQTEDDKKDMPSMR